MRSRSPRGAEPARARRPRLADFLAPIGDNVQRLPDRYLGYYFRYFYSFAYPGYITKSFVSFLDGRSYRKNIETLGRLGTDRLRDTFKYVGLIYPIADRLYVIEYEAILKTSLTQTILYPSYHSHVTFLIGVQTALSKPGRQPAASRALFEHLGTQIDVKRALGSCGHFRHDGDEIDPRIKERIRNNILPDDFVFSVPEG